MSMTRSNPADLRTPLTAYQLGELEKAYDRGHYPTSSVHQELALTLNMSKIHVRNWFAERRFRPGETRRRNENTAPNRQTTNLGSILDPPIATSSQSSTVNPPGSVNNRASDQPPYGLNSYTNSLPPAAGPYRTFYGQYTPSTPNTPQFSVRRTEDCTDGVSNDVDMDESNNMHPTVATLEEPNNSGQLEDQAIAQQHSTNIFAGGCPNEYDKNKSISSESAKTPVCLNRV